MEVLGLALAFVGALFGGYGATRWNYHQSRLDALLHIAPEYAAVLRRIGQAEMKSKLPAEDPAFDDWQVKMSAHLADLPPRLRAMSTDRTALSMTAGPVAHGQHLVRIADMLDEFTKAEADHRDKWPPFRGRRARERDWSTRLPAPSSEPPPPGSR